MTNHFYTLFSSIFITNTLLLITAVTCATILLATNPYHMWLLLACYFLIACITIFYKNNQWLLITLCSFLCSLIAVHRVNHQQLTYKSYNEYLHKPVTIEGTITQIDHSRLTKNQTTLLIQTSNITFKKNTLTAPQCISVFMPTKLTKYLREHQIIKIDNCKLEQPINNKNYERYLIKEGIWSTAHCGQHSIQIIETQPKPAHQNIRLILQNNISRFSKKLFNALFLGKKEKCITTLTTQHQCVQWGIAHHMARSGAHLAILLGLLLLLLHYIQLPHSIQYVLCLVLLLGYAHISYPTISFTRALCMSMLFIICKLFRLLPSTLHILTLVTLFVVLYNPVQIFFLDFQLSFGITYIIIWLFTLKSQSTIALRSRNSVRSQ